VEDATNSWDQYDGHMRLAQFDVASEELDWYHEQKKWFGQSTTLVYANWDSSYES